MITAVTGKNQVTIPAKIARAYRIEPGTRLEWLEGNRKNELRVTVYPGPKEILRRIHEIGARYDVSAKDVECALTELREEEDATPDGETDRNEERVP